jgi:hypothetical protein
MAVVPVIPASARLRLVELHYVRPGREQVRHFLVHRLRVAEREILRGGVVIILRLLGHGERARHSDLDGPAGVRAQEGHVRHLDRVPAPDRPGHPRNRIGMAAAVQRGPRIVDVNTVESRGEPVGVALPAHLPVGDDVQAGQFLIPDGQQRRIALGLLEVGGIDPPQLRRPHSRREPLPQPSAVDEPVRLGITADQGCGQEHDSHNVTRFVTAHRSCEAASALLRCDW